MMMGELLHQHLQQPSASKAGRLNLPAIAGGVPVREPHRPLLLGAPSVGEDEISAIAQCLRSGWIGPGQRVAEFESEFARYKGAPHAIAVSSGTAAIQLALFGIGIKPGDEVIVPAMTFAPSLHTIIHAGATPVLADCDQATFGIDPVDVERRITSRTKAILAVHMCGRCCDMSALLDLARRHGLKVIEDCAHAIEATLDGRPSGLMGDIGCFSFYATKNLTTGDGGMVLTRDDRLHRRMRRVALQGVTAGAWKRFVCGRRSYQVVSPGFRCAMNDIAAAIGLTQLRRLEERWRRRERLWQTYAAELQGLPLRFQAPVPPNSRHARHLLSAVLDVESAGLSRAALVEALWAENIGCGVHYQPVHEQRYFRRKLGVRKGDLPNASYVGERTLSLPMSPDLSEQDIADVAEALRRILRYRELGVTAVESTLGESYV